MLNWKLSIENEQIYFILNNNLTIKLLFDYREISEFIEKGTYFFNSDRLNGTFQITNKNIIFYDDDLLSYKDDNGRLAHEKFIELCKSNKNLKNLIDFCNFIYGKGNEEYILRNYVYPSNTIEKDLFKFETNNYLEKDELINKKLYGEYANWCIEKGTNDDIDNLIISYINSNSYDCEDLCLGSDDVDIPFEGLDYETILNHNIIYNAIKRRKYKLVKSIIKTYGLGKDNMGNLKFKRSLFCPDSDALSILFYREEYSLLYFFFENGMTEDYFIHLR